MAKRKSKMITSPAQYREVFRVMQIAKGVYGPPVGYFRTAQDAKLWAGKRAHAVVTEVMFPGETWRWTRIARPARTKRAA